MNFLKSYSIFIIFLVSIITIQSVYAIYPGESINITAEEKGFNNFSAYLITDEFADEVNLSNIVFTNKSFYAEIPKDFNTGNFVIHLYGYKNTQETVYTQTHSSGGGGGSWRLIKPIVKNNTSNNITNIIINDSIIIKPKNDSIENIDSNDVKTGWSKFIIIISSIIGVILIIYFIFKWLGNRSNK